MKRISQVFHKQTKPSQHIVQSDTTTIEFSGTNQYPTDIWYQIAQQAADDYDFIVTLGQVSQAAREASKIMLDARTLTFTKMADYKLTLKRLSWYVNVGEPTEAEIQHYKEAWLVKLQIPWTETSLPRYSSSFPPPSDDTTMPNLKHVELDLFGSGPDYLSNSMTECLKTSASGRWTWEGLRSHFSWAGWFARLADFDEGQFTVHGPLSSPYPLYPVLSKVSRTPRDPDMKEHQEYFDSKVLHMIDIQSAMATTGQQFKQRSYLESEAAGHTKVKEAKAEEGAWRLLARGVAELKSAPYSAGIVQIEGYVVGSKEARQLEALLSSEMRGGSTTLVDKLAIRVRDLREPREAGEQLHL